MSEIYHGVSILKESMVKMIKEEINKSNFGIFAKNKISRIHVRIDEPRFKRRDG